MLKHGKKEYEVKIKQKTGENCYIAIDVNGEEVARAKKWVKFMRHYFSQFFNWRLYSVLATLRLAT